MKKKLLGLILFILLLTGCTEVCTMYKLDAPHIYERVEDFKYTIINSYSEYEDYKEKYAIKKYKESFFKSKTMIILLLGEGVRGNVYALSSSTIEGSELSINIKLIKGGLSTALSTDAYCLEVKTKGIEKVLVTRLTPKL